MSDRIRETRKTETQTSQSVFTDAYKDFSETYAKLQGRSRQAALATYGAVVGTIKDAPNEFVNHPVETAGKVAIAGATGAVLSAAMAAESPVIAGAAIGGAVIGTGIAIKESFEKLWKDEKLKGAMSDVYNSGDIQTMAKSLGVATDVIGPEAFNFAIDLGGLRGGAKGFHHYKLNKLSPFLPMPEITPFRAVELRFADGSVLHAHGKQAILQSPAGEAGVRVFNNRTIDLTVKKSERGREFLTGHAVNGKPFTIDIDPRAGITKATADRAVQFKHSEVGTRPTPFPQLCDECRPLKQSVEESTRISGGQ